MGRSVLHFGVPVNSPGVFSYRDGPKKFGSDLRLKGSFESFWSNLRSRGVFVLESIVLYLPGWSGSVSGSSTLCLMVAANSRKKRRGPKHPHTHAREVALQALYQLEVGGYTLEEVLALRWLNSPMEESARSYFDELVRGVHAGRPLLEAVIREHSHKDFTQVSMVIRSILAIGIFEMGRAQVPAEVIIDDLLNLTRTYDGEESVAFVNGILDAASRRSASPDSPE